LTFRLELLKIYVLRIFQKKNTHSPILFSQVNVKLYLCLTN
jgi:hypothetical protein